MTDQQSTHLEQMAADARVRIGECAGLAELEALKVELFGKKGAITALLKTLGGLPPDERREVGARINAARDQLTTAMAERQTALERAELDRQLAAGRIDVTQPGRYAPRASSTFPAGFAGRLRPGSSLHGDEDDPSCTNAVSGHGGRCSAVGLLRVEQQQRFQPIDHRQLGGPGPDQGSRHQRQDQGR